MKKLLFLLLALCFVSSCKNEYEKNLERMSLLAKQEIENHLFKSNSVINIIEFSPVKYDVVTMNTIDTIRLLKIGEMIDNNLDLAKSYKERAQLQFKEVGLHKEIGFSDKLIKIEIEEGKGYLEKGREYINIAEGYIAKDSIIRDRILKRGNSENIYRFSLFLKAIVKSNAEETTNYIDTLTFYFDEKMNLLQVNDY